MNDHFLYQHFDTYDTKTIGFYDFGSGEKTLAVTASLHGDEHTAAYVAELLINFLRENNSNLHSQVRIIPIANPSAFKARKRKAPEDNLNLNRIFLDSSITSISGSYASQIWSLTKEFNCVIDLHCCGDHGSIYGFIDPACKRQLKLAKNFGITTYITAKNYPGVFFSEVLHDDRQGILIEIPGGQPGGIIDLHAAEYIFAKFKRFLVLENIIDKKECKNVNLTEKQIKIFGNIKSKFTEKYGLFIKKANPGSFLSKGDDIGLFNNQPIKMPYTGQLLSINATRYLFPGDFLYNSCEFLENK